MGDASLYGSRVTVHTLLAFSTPLRHYPGEPYMSKKQGLEKEQSGASVCYKSCTIAVVCCTDRVPPGSNSTGCVHSGYS
jgi:hypothetical protein